MKTKISKSVVQLCALAGSLALSLPAAAQIISDDHLTNVVVSSSGVINGGLELNGTSVDFGYEEFIAGSCITFANGSAVVVSGTTATYTADCGVFDVQATVRMISPLNSLPGNSGGFEREFVYTNPTGLPQNLESILAVDADLGSAFLDDFAVRDATSGAVVTYDAGEAIDRLAATIVATDQPGATFGYDVAILTNASTTFPMDNAPGPIGPEDMETSIGVKTTVAPGASVTVWFRTIYTLGTLAVPADFDMSGCYSSPVNGCRAGSKSVLAIKDNAVDAKDKFKWKLIGAPATTQDEFADPVTTADYSVCLYNASSDQFDSIHVSPGFWGELGTKGYKMIDPAGTGFGATKVLLKGGVDGKTKVGFSGSGVNLPDPLLGGITTPVKVQLRSGDNPGTCWESSLGTALVNDAGLLKLKTP